MTVTWILLAFHSPNVRVRDDLSRNACLGPEPPLSAHLPTNVSGPSAKESRRSRSSANNSSCSRVWFWARDPCQFPPHPGAEAADMAGKPLQDTDTPCSLARLAELATSGERIVSSQLPWLALTGLDWGGIRHCRVPFAVLVEPQSNVTQTAQYVTHRQRRRRR